MTGFLSPKLFGWSGRFQDNNMFMVVTNDTNSRTHEMGTWAGYRMNFQETGISLLTYVLAQKKISKWLALHYSTDL